MIRIAPVLQLLWPGVHLVRTVQPFLERPLVLRQTQHDRLEIAMVQWDVAVGHVFLLSSRVGHIPIATGVSGRMARDALGCEGPTTVHSRGARVKSTGSFDFRAA